MSLFRSNKKSLYLLLLSGLTVAACGGGGSDGGNGGGGNGLQPGDEWLVNTAYIADGGPGADGIPAIENPIFEAAAMITTVEPDDLVIALRRDGEVKVYPHDIMNYHEVLNDGPVDDPFTMSYCPLTGSAVAWEGTVSHADSSFGVSGLIYNSNLLLYDRETQTIWSQMLQLAVNGPRIREKPEPVQVIETSFETITAMFPEAMVMTRETGIVRPYDNYPYGDYETSSDLLFGVGRRDSRMSLKARVIGIHDDDKAKIYQLSAFGAATQTINDHFNNQPIVVVGHSTDDFAAIYSRELPDGSILSMSPIQNDLPNVMTDTEGNVWDIFGSAVSGPRAGAQLESTRSYTAMWFAWVAHFSSVEINFN